MSDDNTVRFTRKGLATQARVVNVAAKLMFERGVSGTSMDELRSTASVSGSQIAHYFQDKRDLTRQVIASRRNDVMAFHSQPQLGALDSLEALQSWADACVADVDAVYRRGGCVYGPWPVSCSKPTTTSSTISPPAMTNGLSYFAPGSRPCAGAAICNPTPTHATSRLRWWPHIRAAP